MKALLLIAGRSTRFWPLAEKTFFPVCGTSLMEIQLKNLSEAGFSESDIIVVGGEHNLEEVRSRYPNLATVEQEDLSLGMRGALLSALPQCGAESVMIVCSNDVIEPSAYNDLKASLDRFEVAGALLAQKVERYFPGGYLEVDGERITSIIEKPGEGNEPSDLVNIVAHVHRDPAILLEELKKTKPKRDDGYEQALASLFKEKLYVSIPYEGFWQAVKYPWHLLSLAEHLLSGITEQKIHPSAEIHPTAVIDGPVIIEEGTKIFPHSTVRGPCYIGPNCIVANNALVRGASIGSHCVVGYSTEVKSSVCAGHMWTHMSYVGDSVIGENVSFGAGCASGNLRLDEQEVKSTVQNEEVLTERTKLGVIVGSHCRFGAHVSTAPGVKIGPDTFVAGHMLISEDVLDKSFVVLKDGKLVIRPNRTQAPRPEDRDEFRALVRG